MRNLGFLCRDDGVVACASNSAPGARIIACFSSQSVLSRLSFIFKTTTHTCIFLLQRELDIYLYDGRICQEEKSEKSVCMLFDDACSVVTVPPTDTRSYDYEYTAPLEAHLAASPLYLHPEERNSSPFTWSTWLVMSLQGRGLAYPSISGIISGIIECARMWLLPLADFELRTPVRVIKDDDVSAQDVLPAHVMFSVDVPEQVAGFTLPFRTKQSHLAVSHQSDRN